VERLDLLQEYSVEAGSLRWGPVPPGVVTRVRDTKKKPAQHRDRVPGLLRLDEAEGAHRVPSSFAKKALRLFSGFLSPREGACFLA
jgi:hypothetical protein